MDGTFKRWFERIWWKAIIDEQIKITLKLPNKNAETIKPLEFWKDKPWENKVGSEIDKFKGTKVWNYIIFSSTARLQVQKSF